MRWWALLAPSFLLNTHQNWELWRACATSADKFMAIPISDNVRNMKLRKGLTIMTALGIALTVTTAIFIMALLAGLNKAFATSGDPLNILVLRKGSTSELTGPFPAENFQILKTLPGVAKD